MNRRDLVLRFLRHMDGTSHHWRSDGQELRYRGNVVANWTEFGDLILHDAGWQTATTKRTLNDILFEVMPRLRIFCIKGKWWLWDFNRMPAEGDIFRYQYQFEWEGELLLTELSLRTNGRGVAGAGSAQKEA